MLILNFCIFSSSNLLLGKSREKDSRVDISSIIQDCKSNISQYQQSEILDRSLGMGIKEAIVKRVHSWEFQKLKCFFKCIVLIKTLKYCNVFYRMRRVSVFVRKIIVGSFKSKFTCSAAPPPPFPLASFHCLCMLQPKEAIKQLIWTQSIE